MRLSTLAALALAAIPMGGQQNLPPGLAGNLPPAPLYELPPLAAKYVPPGAKPGPAAIGKHRAVPKAAINKGMWEQTGGGRTWRLALRSAGAGGGRTWRLALRSAGADALRLHFEDFAAGGGRLWIYGGKAGSEQVMGPYTDAGPDKNGRFWSDMLFTDTVTVEYEAPPQAPGRTQLPFRLTEVAHVWK